MLTTKKEYRAVLFDMDGLMFDTERLAKRGLYEAAQELGLNPDMELFVGLTGCNRAEALSRMTDFCGTEAIRKQLFLIEEQKIAAWVKESGTPLKPGLLELIRCLNEKSIRKAVVSCSMKVRVLPCIQYAGLQTEFDLIITGEEVQNGKPAPDAYLLAAERLGIAPEHCLVLEDTVSGGMAGLKAGMDVALIPDLIVPTEEQIERFQYCEKSLLDVIPLFKGTALPVI